MSPSVADFIFSVWQLLLAILKTSRSTEQRLLVTWLYGINGKQTLDSSFLLTFQQYIQWHWLETESVHLLFGILLRQFDRHGERFCSLNEMGSFICHLLFPSFKIDGYVTEKRTEKEAERIFQYGQILVSHLQRLKTRRDDLIETVWIDIENAFVRSEDSLRRFHSFLLMIRSRVERNNWNGSNGQRSTHWSLSIMKSFRMLTSKVDSVFIWFKRFGHRHTRPTNTWLSSFSIVYASHQRWSEYFSSV